MNEQHSTEAIVLKRWDYSEKDQIISFFSKEKGRVQGIAKGIKSSKRRFVGSLDLFCHSRITFRESKKSSLVFIEEAKLLNPFEKIRADYNSILLASGLLEMSYRFYPEGEKNDLGFEVLHEGLMNLEKLGGSREIFWSTLLKNQKVIGWFPHFHSCMKCKEEEHSSLVGFDLKRGGMVCHSCLSDYSEIVSIPLTLQKWITDISPPLRGGDQGEGDGEYAQDHPHPGPLPSRERGALLEEEILSQILESHLAHQAGLQIDWKRFLEFVD